MHDETLPSCLSLLMPSGPEEAMTGEEALAAITLDLPER